MSTTRNFKIGQLILSKQFPTETYMIVGPSDEQDLYWVWKCVDRYGTIDDIPDDNVNFEVISDVS